MPERNGFTHIENTIRQRAFSLAYQPIVHLEEGTLSGVEALSRFPDGSSPQHWFEECERLGLAAAMDEAVVDVIAGDVDQLPAEGYVALNLSAATLSSPDLPDLLSELAKRRQVVVELTEHAVVEDYEVIVDTLVALREHGILLAVDDAGAGYSTFQHILRLRPDIIKLDRSITHSIDADPARRALASAVVIFAAEIAASVVAEGVETEAELIALRRAGVSRAQGYFLAKPARLPLGAIPYEPLPYIELLEPGFSQPADAEARPWERAHGAADSDATLAVLAHGALSSLASVSSALELFRTTDGTLPKDEYRALCSVMQRHVGHVAGLLEDVVRGLPPEVILDLNARRTSVN